MKPWWNPPLTGYSCKDFQSRTTQRRLLLRKDEIRAVSLWGTRAYQTLSKTLNISSAIAWAARYLAEILAVLSNAIVRISAVTWEDLKPYWKSEERPYLSKWFTRLLFTSFPKTPLTIERRLTGDLTVKICLTFLSPYLRNSLAFSKIRFHNQLILLY